LVLRELETFGLMRDPERYHLTIYGKPDAKAAWGWRFEGHHLSLNFTLAGDTAAADTPSFFGANPAMVPKQAKFGAKQGLRVLGAEEDEARRCCESLSDAQRREAVFDTRPTATSSPQREKVDRRAGGIAAAKLDEKQRAQLLKLIELYAASFEPALAQARMARVREGGIEASASAGPGAPSAASRTTTASRAAVPDRVRRLAERRQPRAHGMARLQRRLRPRPAEAALRGPRARRTALKLFAEVFRSSSQETRTRAPAPERSADVEDRHVGHRDEEGDERAERELAAAKDTVERRSAARAASQAPERGDECGRRREQQAREERRHQAEGEREQTDQHARRVVAVLLAGGE
jgi:hypothetical protein